MEGREWAGKVDPCSSYALKQRLWRNQVRRECWSEVAQSGGRQRWGGEAQGSRRDKPALLEACGAPPGSPPLTARTGDVLCVAGMERREWGLLFGELRRDEDRERIDFVRKMLFINWVIGSVPPGPPLLIFFFFWAFKLTRKGPIIVGCDYKRYSYKKSSGAKATNYVRNCEKTGKR